MEAVGELSTADQIRQGQRRREASLSQSRENVTVNRIQGSSLVSQRATVQAFAGGYQPNQEGFHYEGAGHSEASPVAGSTVPENGSSTSSLVNGGANGQAISVDTQLTDGRVIRTALCVEAREGKAACVLATDRSP